MKQLMNTETLEGAIWSRLIGAKRPGFSRAMAQSILAIEFSEEDKTRMHELAAKARGGALSPRQQEAVETYSRVGSILGIMKSKARLPVKSGSSKI
jgi:hypothetical protein